MDLEPAEQLERGNAAGDPADVDLGTGRHEQTLVVVAPGERRDGTLEQFRIRSRSRVTTCGLDDPRTEDLKSF